MEHLKEKLPLPAELWEMYKGSYQRMEVPAKTVLLHEGEVSRRAYLIEKGCLRAWFNNKGKDITFQFFFENEAVSSLESFQKMIPSFFTIEAIEPTVLYAIEKKDLDALMNQALQVYDFQRFWADTLMERQLHYMKHFLSFIKDTPWERYQNFIKERPQLIQRVPQHYIASYLGITPVSLSRIRNRRQ